LYRTRPAPRLNHCRAASPPRTASVWPGYVGGALKNCSLRGGRRERGWSPRDSDAAWFDCSSTREIP
jgi:hypothetical protein